MNKEQELKIPLVISSELNRFYATGSIVGFNPFDFRIMFFNEEAINQDELITTSGEIGSVRVVNNELTISPLTAKNLVKILTQKIEEYESKIGPINEPKKKLIKLEEKK